MVELREEALLPPRTGSSSSSLSWRAKPHGELVSVRCPERGERGGDSVCQSCDKRLFLSMSDES